MLPKNKDIYESYSSDPSVQKMMRNQLKVYGTMENVMKASSNYLNSLSSSNNNKKDSYPCLTDSQAASSNGKYMTHCYYGCQPGNKITTIIG